MEDVAPQLLEKIRASFAAGMQGSRVVAGIRRRVQEKTATLQDANRYAQEVGEILSEALQENLTEDSLPDGKLYWNIATRTIQPGLEENHRLINAEASEIQTLIDEAQGIGLNPVPGTVPAGRIKGLLEKATRAEDYAIWLREPIVNVSSAFADDFMRENAAARVRAGLKETIIRTLGNHETRTVRRGNAAVRYQVPCEWCRRLAGTYEYPMETDEEVFQRHEFCRCTVVHRTERKSTNVWTKEPQEDLEARRTYGLDIFRRAP